MTAIVAPIAEKRTKGAWYREWRLISLDGSTLDTADTAENEKAFGRPGASRGSSAFPKIRFVALLENGTHVLWAARMSNMPPTRSRWRRDVVPALRQGMLCLADRFFPELQTLAGRGSDRRGFAVADPPECTSGCRSAPAGRLLSQSHLRFDFGSPERSARGLWSA